MKVAVMPVEISFVPLIESVTKADTRAANSWISIKGKLKMILLFYPMSAAFHVSSPIKKRSPSQTTFLQINPA